MIAFLLLFQLFPPAHIAQIHEERIARLEPGSKAAKQAHKDLGLFWLRHNNPAQAELHLRQSQPDPEVTPFLAEAVAAQGRQAESNALFEQCATTARCLSRLAERTNDPDVAIKYLRAALDTEPSPVRKNDLAQALQAAGKMKEAEALFRQALTEQNPNNPETAITQNNLASLLNSTGRELEAEGLQRKAYQALQKSLGPRHVRTGLAASNLADILIARGRQAEARALYQKALAIFEEGLPPNHPWTLEARQVLGSQSK